MSLERSREVINNNKQIFPAVNLEMASCGYLLSRKASGGKYLWVATDNDETVVKSIYQTTGKITRNNGLKWTNKKSLASIVVHALCLNSEIRGEIKVERANLQPGKHVGKINSLIYQKDKFSSVFIIFAGSFCPESTNSERDLLLSKFSSRLIASKKTFEGTCSLNIVRRHFFQNKMHIHSKCIRNHSVISVRLF